ncbi:MAG: DUF2057 domain-containing protein [Marinobacter sp.]|nr:DUF2057 domain-containing protein [Marinobacter sp.]
MKERVLPLALLVSMFSAQASADTTLELGSCLQTHVVNGQEMTAGAGESITLSNGTQQLVVDCTANLGRSDDDTFPETSEAFVLLFKAADANLTLSAPALQTRRDMDSLNRKQNFRLVTDTGTPVNYQVDVLEKEGFQVFRDYAEELTAFNRTESPAALLSRLPASSGANTNSAKPLSEAGSQGAVDQETVRQMLRYWYLQADTKTRNEWKNWIQSSN